MNGTKSREGRAQGGTERRARAAWRPGWWFPAVMTAGVVVMAGACHG
jgi:hypothetical protein